MTRQELIKKMSERLYSRFPAGDWVKHYSLPIAGEMLQVVLDNIDEIVEFKTFPDYKVQFKDDFKEKK